MIDKKGKIFGKISIIDLMVALIIVTIIVGTIYRFGSPVTASITGGNATINYTILIEDVRYFSANYYEEGLNVYDSNTGNFIGKIKDIRVEPYMGTIEMKDGTMVLAEKTERVKIFLDIEASGVVTDKAYLVGGTYEVKVGGGAYISTKYVDVTSSIFAVSGE